MKNILKTFSVVAITLVAVGMLGIANSASALIAGLYNPGPTKPAEYYIVVPDFFKDGSVEYKAWKNANPGYDCAATMLDLVSTKVQDFELWYCTPLNSTTALALQVNNETGRIIPVKFRLDYNTCEFRDMSYTTSTGYVRGITCLVNEMVVRGLP